MEIPFSPILAFYMPKISNVIRIRIKPFATDQTKKLRITVKQKYISATCMVGFKRAVPAATAEYANICVEQGRKQGDLKPGVFAKVLLHVVEQKLLRRNAQKIVRVQVFYQHGVVQVWTNFEKYAFDMFNT